MARKTLYLTDLDGTLFGPDARVSARTHTLLNDMLARGLLFSVATARSAASAMERLEGLRLTLPIAMMNGVLLFDPVTGRYTRHVPVEQSAAEAVVRAMDEAGKTAYVFTFEDGVLCANYKRLSTPFERQFCEERQKSGMKKFTQVDDFLPIIRAQDPVFFSVTGTYDELLPLRDAVCAATQGLNIMMYEDFCDHIWFLEIFSAKASKAAALLWLRDICGAEETVCFGDNYNDVAMLRTADRSYAVENAVAAAKEAATAVIGSNGADAVAELIYSEFI